MPDITVSPALLAAISLVSAVGGAGGIAALFKLKAEKGQITVSAAQGAVIVHSTVLKDIKQDYDRLAEELAQVRMEGVTREQEHETCKRKIAELQLSVTFLQRDLDRHGRLSELARRKSHVAIHAIGGYELLIDEILSEMRRNNVPIPAELRPYNLRAAFQAEMDKLEELEATITEQAMRTDPPNADATV